ncbi:threonine/serine dehydratase [Corynebacterium sp. CCM 9203]|uniref:threonine ammonia-lyase n=1 Tax=Corynebacterium sp. CCM 9203 TaxID=3057615 RepID=UPI003525D40F
MVDFEDIRTAHRHYTAILPPTPAFSYPTLNAVCGGASVVVKHENTQPTGAFKIRGGISYFAERMAQGTRLESVVTASTGNHAQSIAWSAARNGVDALIVVPETTPEAKVHAISGWGARVVRYGATMSEALTHARDEYPNRVFVSPSDPDIIAGHGGVYLELLQQHPDLEVVYVPVGSGTGACGAILVRDALAPECRIIGVQSAQAPAAHHAWTTGEPTEITPMTRAAGLATGSSYPEPQRIMRGLDDFILVDDTEIDLARRILATRAHTLAEGAGAAGLAGLLADFRRETASANHCAIVVTGGNADDNELATLGC